MARAAVKKKAAPRRARFVREQGGIAEYALPNGLRILLAPDESVPVAGCMVTYHVGSRNEKPGYTGSAHLLEHLLFKGSEKFNPEKGTMIDKVLETKGARMNATTSFDRTNYYEVVPTDLLPLAIEIEADRMRTAWILEKDRVSEMPVVRSEYEIGENQPTYAVEKLIWSTAFQAHPYHHPVIGWKSDIETVSIKELNRFYNDYYWPDNATVTIAGKFDPKQALALVEEFFGVHPKASQPIPEVTTTEPPQEGERRFVIERTGVDTFAIAYKIPHALHPDLSALTLLASILYEDKTSRLYRLLVDPSLATNVMSYAIQLKNPALLETYVTLAPGVTHEKIEKLVRAEFRRIRDSGVTAREVARAKQAIRAYFATRRDGPYALLSSLNEDIATGDWTRFVTFPEAIAKVTPADVRRVARTYLRDDQATVGWFVAKK